MNIDAEVDFFVTTFSPVEHFEKLSELRISGINLDNIISAEFIRSTDAIPVELKIDKINSESIIIHIDEDVEVNSCFFVILKGENKSWYPVGPMLKLDSRSMRQ